jgi:hypothetical protein
MPMASEHVNDVVHRKQCTLVTRLLYGWEKKVCKYLLTNVIPQLKFNTVSI